MANKPAIHKPICITQKVKDRFWRMVQKSNSCWEWKGAINPNGYGVIKIDGSNRSAHRVSYAIEHGEIQYDRLILHKCHNAKCVNPDHLYSGTQAENIQDEVDRKNTRHYKCANPSKFNGVRWDEKRKNWISAVYINKKFITIGRHTSEIDAARNHDRIRYMRFGLIDRLNFPEEYELK